MTVKTQECSTAGCVKPAAFTTRTRPAWCIDCLDKMLREAGLEPAEPFPGPRAWWLTSCLTCGVRIHYRLEYILTTNACGEITCRACRWTAQDQMVAAMRARRQIVATGRDEHGFDLIGSSVDINDGDDRVITRCRTCGKLSAKRMDDVGWECTCSPNSRSSGTETIAELSTYKTSSSNKRSSHPISPRVGRVLLRESQSPALAWWDHERNDVLVSSTLRDLVIGSGLEFEDRGAHELKGVPGEWHLSAVVSPRAT
jgi:hypothetical protein